MFATVNTEFSNWLTDELQNREWSQSELSRRAGVSPAAISDVLSGRRNPGKDLCTAIAKAFKIPQNKVFQIAGILEEEVDSNDPRIKKIEYLYNSLQDEGNTDKYTAFLEDEVGGIISTFKDE